ncbi:mate-domain-containing protein [Zychaea mexicana]|uniref:mate-domain-containing protein n=1 Tax=Zychaea mexicana TaxID=64656 RepID=UPI0022FECF9C|nr:mate-domain-containing protein [Zychaea mexicana]KAI9494266.1 mate-domain-containing protein [Zychaea mexicana]
MVKAKSEFAEPYGTDDEALALLLDRSRSSSSDDDDNDFRHCRRHKPEESYTEHFYWLFSSSMALIGCKFIQQLSQLVTVSTVGHLGSQELAGMSLAEMLVRLTTLSLALGMTSALDTLCAQSWTGAKDKTSTGLHLQRGIILYSVLTIPIFVLWAISLHLLSLFRNHQKDTDYVVQYAGLYLLSFVPGSFAYAGYHMCGSFLQAQGIMRVGAYGAALSLPVTAAANYVLVTGKPFELGVSGAALADASFSVTILALIVTYIVFVTGPQGWNGWSASSLHGWWSIIRLCIPTYFFFLFRQAAPQLCTLAASQFGTKSLAAYFILHHTDGALASFGHGLKHATLTRIGNLMGKGSLADTRRAIIVGGVLAVSIGSAAGVFVLAFRSSYSYIYTNDEDVARIVRSALPLIALKQLIGLFGSFMLGICEGLGHQRVGAVVSFVSSFIIGVPLCYVFAFTWHLSIYGLWIGLTISEAILTLTLSLHLWMLDWSEEVRGIKKHILTLST